MITMKLQGGPQFAKALDGLKLSKAKGALRNMLLKAGEPIHERAEELVPVGTIAPHIVDHIAIQAVTSVADEDFGGKVRLEDTEAAVAIGPEKDWFYGKFLEIEYGGVKHPPQPFLRPAFDERVGGAIQSVQDDIWAWLRNHADRSVAGRNL